MTDVIAWSYSAMNTYDTCPRQYREKYVTKSVKFVQNEAGRWGDAVHKALENAIKAGTPLPANMVMYQPFPDAVMARAKRMKAQLIPEQGVALTRDLKQVSWFTRKGSKTPVWFRIKIDVVSLAGDYAEVYDWKTGRKKHDEDQLHLSALTTFILFPDVNTVRAGFVWLKDREITPPVEYTRDQMPAMLDYWVGKYEILEEAWELDEFPPNPSGLCYGWCEVTDCPHWQPKR